MRKISGCFILFIIMMSSQIFAGTDYYVDATNGNNLNNGLTPETAWRTISKVNEPGFSYNPGDSILFKRGEVWREQLVPPSSGVSGNLITFGVYGSGNAPLIMGSKDLSGATWINYGGNIWYNDDLSFDPHIVWLDDESYWEADNANSVDSINRWFWDGGVTRLYIYAISNPTSFYSSIEAPFRQRACIINDRGYIKLENIHFKYGLDHVVLITGASAIGHHTLSNCTIEGNGQYNGTLYLLYGNDYCTVEYCNIHSKNKKNLDNTLYIRTDSNNIRHNVITDGAHSCIDLRDCSNNIIEYNEVYDTDQYWFGRGIALEGTSNGFNIVRYNYFHDLGGDTPAGGAGKNQFCGTSNLIYYNVFANNKDDGVVIWGGSGTGEVCNDNEFYNNVIYGSEGAGLRLAFAPGASGNKIYNNIIFENDTDNHYQVYYRQNGPVIEAAEVKYNCIYDSSTSNTVWIRYGAEAGDHTVAYMESSHLDEWANNVVSNPNFVNATNGNFLLDVTSLCIDAGTDVGLTQDHAGNTVPYGYGVDIGAYEYVGENPPLNANVDASPNSGETPLTVNFTGNATGGISPYSYSWNFGDGGNSTEQNPSHTYYAYGNYTAILTVTDNQSSQDSDSVTITVTTPLTPVVASGNASPTSGDYPLTVYFTGNATGGAPPYSYNWDFGDGGYSNQQNPSHTYNSSGNYTVILTVTDSNNNQDTDSITITVTAPIYPLVASCIASPTSGDIPFAVYFSGGATGGILPYSYNWNFGDGSSSTQQNPSHTYNAAGNYTATLTVTDNQGSQDSVSLTIDANSSQIPAYLSCSPSSLVFNATVSGSPQNGQYLRIINAGNGTMTWSIQDNANWLTCSPTSGTSRGSVQVSVNASGFSPGLYTATITLSSPQAYNSPQYVSVDLRVVEPGVESDPFGAFDSLQALKDGKVKRVGIKTNSDPSIPPEAIDSNTLVSKGNAFIVDNLSESSDLSRPELKSIDQEDKTESLTIGLKEIWGGLNTERESINILKIQLEELEPLRIVFTSSLRENISFIGWGEDEQTALPIGSTLDTENGEFSWVPQPGSIGQYILHFAVTDGSRKSEPLQFIVNVISKRDRNKENY